MKCFPAFAAACAVLLVSCTQSENPVGLLPQEDRAPQFDQVSEFLDLGGVFYAYMDLTNEAENLGRKLTEVLSEVKSSIPNVPPVPLDFEKVMAATGLSGLDAIGMSSRETEEGRFHNRSILFFPEGVSGFFRIFGDTPHPFDSLDLAPASADMVFEMSYRPTEVRDTILAVGDALAGTLGRGIIAARLQAPIPEMGNRTLNQLIEGAGNRGIGIIDFDTDTPLNLAQLGTVPRTEFLFAVDGITDLMMSAQALVEQQPDIQWTETATGFEITVEDSAPPPFDYVQPVLVADTQTERVFLASNRAFLEECLQNGNKLKDTEDFREAANFLPPEGVLLSYVSPEYSEALLTLISSSLNASPMADPRMAEVFKMLIPSIEKPMAAVTTVGPEGLYSASNLSYSHRTTIASLSLQPLVFAVGMGSAMAIPAFQKVRTNSKEKTILNNLRMVSSGGQQYLLEEGVEKVTYEQLVPTYFREITPVAGEDYTGLVVEALGGTLSVTTDSGKTIEYEY